jgi:glycerophosphoryl diester phosphodiesterase
MNTDGIETDVHMTKDGVLVLMHDEKVDRTTNGTGYIKDYTYDELYQLNANYNKEGYDFCHVPTLEELLKLALKNMMF